VAYLLITLSLLQTDYVSLPAEEHYFEIRLNFSKLMNENKPIRVSAFWATAMQLQSQHSKYTTFYCYGMMQRYNTDTGGFRS